MVCAVLLMSWYVYTHHIHTSMYVCGVYVIWYVCNGMYVIWCALSCSCPGTRTMYACGVRMYACICILDQFCVCMYIHVCVSYLHRGSVDTHIHALAHVCICILCVCMFMCVCVYVYVVFPNGVHVYVYTHAHYAHAYAHTHTHTHTHTCRKSTTATRRRWA